jgi:hypothetical protein
MSASAGSTSAPERRGAPAAHLSPVLADDQPNRGRQTPVVPFSVCIRRHKKQKGHHLVTGDGLGKSGNPGAGAYLTCVDSHKGRGTCFVHCGNIET